jgi:hypothetical protein
MNIMLNEGLRSPSVRVDPEALTDQARLGAYAMINSFLCQQRILTADLGLRPTPALIYLTIAMASIQKFARRPGPGGTFRGVEPLPASECGAISRRALSEATGLPRETARRAVKDLLKAGLITDLGARGVTSSMPACIPEATRQKLETLAIELGRLFDDLRRLGILASG